jgi:signal transduction histidine kinase
LGEEQDKPFRELLGSLVELNHRMSPGCEIELAVEEGFPPMPLGETGTELLRIFQEVLTNVRRHANARNVLVTLAIEGDDLVAEVSDDGWRFVLGITRGMRLKSMRERAAMVSGELDVESEPGKGTRVCFHAPLYASEVRTEGR